MSTARLIYFITAGVLGATLASYGEGVSSWQYWIVMACFIISHLCGCAHEEQRRK